MQWQMFRQLREDELAGEHRTPQREKVVRRKRLRVADFTTLGIAWQYTWID